MKTKIVSSKEIREKEGMPLTAESYIEDKMKLGDVVEWSSQSAGFTRLKRGKIVEVMPPGRRPKMKSAGMGRDHESYVVRAFARIDGVFKNPKKYWPRVSLLKKVKNSES